MPLTTEQIRSTVKCDQGKIYMRPCAKVDDVKGMTDAEIEKLIAGIIADPTMCDLGAFKDLQDDLLLNEDEQEVKTERWGSYTLKSSYKKKFNVTFTRQSMCMHEEIATLSGARQFTGTDGKIYSVDVEECTDKALVDIVIVTCDENGDLKDIRAFLCMEMGGTLTQTYKDFCETGEISESPVEVNSQGGSCRVTCNAPVIYDNKGAIEDGVVAGLPLQSRDANKIVEAKKDDKSDK